VPQRTIGRKACCEVGAGDADDDAIGGRKQGQRVVDRLVHGWVDMDCVQYDVNDGCDDDNREDPGDDGPNAFFRVRIYEFLLILGLTRRSRATAREWSPWEAVRHGRESPRGGAVGKTRIKASFRNIDILFHKFKAGHRAGPPVGRTRPVASQRLAAAIG
jgi:hypothetical protein